ncbi:hypothetical protein CR513_62926, partial [Mucuna pruriens]
MYDFYEHLKITYKVTSVEHPQVNGQAKVTNNVEPRDYGPNTCPAFYGPIIAPSRWCQMFLPRIPEGKPWQRLLGWGQVPILALCCWMGGPPSFFLIGLGQGVVRRGEELDLRHAERIQGYANAMCSGISATHSVEWVEKVMPCRECIFPDLVVIAQPKEWRSAENLRRNLIS